MKRWKVGLVFIGKIDVEIDAEDAVEAQREARAQVQGAATVQSCKLLFADTSETTPLAGAA